MEVISASTPVGISREKAIKQEKLKEAEVEGSVKGIGPETKMRKTGKSQKGVPVLSKRGLETL